MSIEKELDKRSGSVCELCGATEGLSAYEIPSSPVSGADAAVFVCNTCKKQIEDASVVDANHWRCLNDSMWSTVPAVQVLAWRMLNRLKAEGWPQDLLDMLYLEEDVLEWAKAAGDGDEDEDAVIHKDSNGAVLQTGDTVVLIKDLNVKGGGFTAKRGTAVRNIGLVHDNAEQIEGRVNGQQIVILTQYVKKNN
ncbi:PhnA domain-containing protein [Plebeiibacterium marinum]|uniref:PhnA domain-containing protein n=1 Tax=Plebeiibacterium marinum TaxID=2992111 RepID=A0AAE3SIN3_9BACT|nr:alkylphosphonate utilization protein [Plebeiobacterium marinum]MCW3804623.1 PhnA domain-containing protein [Plebeiobacterium marinum]